MFRSLGQFYLTLLLSALIGWAIQRGYTDPSLAGTLGMSYAANNLLALSIFTLLYALRSKHTEKLGFLFLAGSGLRFLVFFLLFYPVFKADGMMTRSEFAVFFLPYGLSTAIETGFLVRVLNRQQP